MGAYAEFIGLDQVLYLVQSRDTPYYAVYISKDLKFECIADGVEEAMNMLEEQMQVPQSNGTTVTYTIKFYKGLTTNGSIDKNTLMGTNTFKLARYDQAPQNYFRAERGLPPVPFNRNSADNNQLATLAQKIEAIEEILIKKAEAEALAAAQAAEEEEEEQPDMVGSILGRIDQIAAVFSRPEIVNLIGMVAGIFKNGIQSVNSMGNVMVSAPTTQEEQTERITNAIQTMFQYDQNLVIHLEKLAHLAQTNTNQFNMLIGMLDKM